ncbi:exodeoxyribonuclease VII large subunit [Candidatus Saccharibacteria bacterium]|nr:exodeoxyribonuclease VII large subunit [Candidatus Saccharibacteria bacterium]
MDGANLPVQLSVSDFVALTNQTLEFAYPTISVVGEVAEFRVSQGKWVSFKLKDDGAVVNCFMTTFALRQPIENGMKLLVVAAPRLNPKGYFNLNVRTLRPVGEGSIKKGFELVKAKLEAEGLFSDERKRPLPRVPASVAVITSTESAAYADFCKIINERWGGLQVKVAHTQVQGDPAADQIIRAVEYFNSLEELPEVLIVIRGGGSAEDLMTFNDERLARTLSRSRIPTLVGVGHEIDHTLADMVADKRAATPTNAAEILVPDKQEIIRTVRAHIQGVGYHMTQAIDAQRVRIRENLLAAVRRMDEQVAVTRERLTMLRQAVIRLHPDRVLEMGYAIVRGDVKPGGMIEVETITQVINAEVRDARQK